ncbi:MAG: hypothetical protein M3N52_04460, partial [Actinomycetota bacterium]|nr:hypothetical protein [Actinomycetota bacterium]
RRAAAVATDPFGHRLVQRRLVAARGHPAGLAERRGSMSATSLRRWRTMTSRLRARRAGRSRTVPGAWPWRARNSCAVPR